MPDPHMLKIFCVSPWGARWGVEKSSWHAHHDVSNFLRDPWGCSVPNYTARGGVHAPHLAHRTSVISPHHRTEERDTLKSTYVKQLPLFGKATEVAIGSWYEPGIYFN